MFVQLPNLIRASAWTGAALVLAMIGMFFVFGVGQDPLQFFHPPQEYAAFLLKNPAAFRAVITLDDCFVVAYSVMFIGTFARLMQVGAPRALAVATVTCTSLLAGLDMLENFHFMTMLAAAERGVLPSVAHIQFQVWQSLFKFHVGYLGVFLLGLAMPRETSGQRVFAFACCWISLPIGALIYAVPAPYSTLFLFGRFAFFMYALISAGFVFGPTSEPAADATRDGVSRAAAGSSALA
jgi:hypothetical protein